MSMVSTLTGGCSHSSLPPADGWGKEPYTPFPDIVGEDFVFDVNG